MISAIRTRPLLVVFGAQASAVTAYNNDWLISAFCFLLTLFCWPRPKLVAFGLILGLASAWCDPAWLEPSAGTHHIEAQVVSSGFNKGRYTIDLGKLKLDGHPVRGLARIVIKRSAVRLQPGARIQFEFVPTVIRPSLSGFDYRRHLRAQGIRLLGQCRSGDDIMILQSGHAPAAVVSKAQASLQSLARPEAEILLAALLGIDGELTNSSKDAFNALGICHLIVISGYNFALVMLFGYTLAYLLGSALSLRFASFDTELVARCVGLGCVGLYWAIVNPGAPTTRAGIMATVLIFGIIAGRRLDSLNVLALAAVLIAARWPLALFTPSFLLSFGAVFGLLAWMPQVRNRSRLMQFVLVTLLASLYTLPVIMHVFGFMAPLSVVWNLLLVPVYSFVIMPLGYAWLVVNWLFTGWSHWLLHASLWAIAQTLECSKAWGRLAPLVRPSICFSLTCAFALLSMPLVESRKRLLLMLTPVLILTGVCGLGSWHGENLQLSLLPNSNSAVVVATKKGATVVFGSGSMGFSRYELAPYLLKEGISRIDLLIMPRPVSNEAGGMPYLIQHFEIGQVWVNVAEHHGSVYDDVIKIAKMRSVPVRVITAGDEYYCNSLNIKVLNPTRAGIMSLDPDLQSTAVTMMDDHAQMLILPKLDTQAQATLNFNRRPSVRGLIQTARQELAVQPHARRSADLIIDGSSSSASSWSDKLWMKVECLPGKLQVKSKSWKADGYHKEDLRLLRGGRDLYE